MSGTTERAVREWLKENQLLLQKHCGVYTWKIEQRWKKGSKGYWYAIVAMSNGDEWTEGQGKTPRLSLFDFLDSRLIQRPSNSTI